MIPLKARFQAVHASLRGKRTRNWEIEWLTKEMGNDRSAMSVMPVNWWKNVRDWLNWLTLL